MSTEHIFHQSPDDIKKTAQQEQQKLSKLGAKLDLPDTVLFKTIQDAHESIGRNKKIFNELYGNLPPKERDRHFWQYWETYIAGVAAVAAVAGTVYWYRSRRSREFPVKRVLETFDQIIEPLGASTQKPEEETIPLSESAENIHKQMLQKDPSGVVITEFAPSVIDQQVLQHNAIRHEVGRARRLVREMIRAVTPETNTQEGKQK